MSGKLTVTCVDWKPHRKGTMRGFASVEIREMRMTIHGIILHQKGANRWAGLPGKPQIDRDGNLVRDGGKIKYTPVIEIADREVRDAFSHRVCEAVEAVAADAFEVAEAEALQ